MVVHQTDGWLLRRGWNAKNCFCKAVDNNNYGRILKDFGSIQSCRGWLGCGCGDSAMISCGTTCEAKVRSWSKNNCPSQYSSTKIRASYSASVCHTGQGGQILSCGK
ncbi:hypothetical protein SNE40_012496 [Patella caerulea]